MTMHNPVSAMLPDGERLHLQHGPIDLIVSANGRTPQASFDAFEAAHHRFETILGELVDELPLLRSQSKSCGQLPRGSVARRMDAAAKAHGSSTFVTPMAAVAGAVADEILDEMLSSGPLDRAYVNNGGDISLHLADGNEFNIMLAGLNGMDLGRVEINAKTPVRGLATSGHGGRSLSLGIADSVTVLAETAAAADVAATLIANAINLPDHPAINRAKACEIDPDSDLEDRMAVVECGILNAQEINDALNSGVLAAEEMLSQGLIWAAALFLKSESRVVGPHAHIQLVANKDY
jgi:uncharacterized protein